MWVLYPRHAYVVLHVASEESQPHGGRDSLGNLRQPVPLYGLPEHRQGGAVCRRQDEPRRQRWATAEHRLKSVAWAILLSARKIYGSYRARGTMSTMFSCPTWCMATSCAAP